MHVVNFPCEKCTKLMGVGPDLLGRKVRCPHCQQVVSAPPPSEPGTFEDSAGQSNSDADRQVSESSEAAKEELASQSPLAPESLLLEVPQKSDFEGGAEPVFRITPAPDSGDDNSPVLESEDIFEQTSSSFDHNDPEIQNDFSSNVKAMSSFMESHAQETLSAGAPEADHAESGGIFPLGASNQRLADFSYNPTEASSEEVLGRQSQASGTSPERPRLFSQTLLIFLIPYCIFTTLATLFFYYQLKQVPHPLEMLPDMPAENPGASRKDPGGTVYERIPPDEALPAKLRVSLGESLRIGDLEVHPISVEQRKITFCSENPAVKPEKATEDSLVLTLELTNTSEDVFFIPTDPVFERRWKLGDPPTAKPYTLLEVGGKRFYGGPVAWKPRVKKGENWRDEDPREYVQGQENGAKTLKPGNHVRTLIATDPTNPEIIKSVRAFDGVLIWRVQVRRGLVNFRDREVSATAVVGVEFAASAVQ